MIKNEKIIILGKSGSGKDHLMRKLSEKGLKPCLKWTTRPPRKFEKRGETYNFVNESLFLESIDNNQFISYQSFKVTPENSNEETWYYGITREEFDNAQIFIMTPGEYNSLGLSEEQRKSCFVVYLDISRSIRESRLYNREDKNDSIKRRLDSDDIDFMGFKDYDLKITDPEFTADDIYDLMS
jgi:guanylate kinase